MRRKSTHLMSKFERAATARLLWFALISAGLCLFTALGLCVFDRQVSAVLAFVFSLTMFYAAFWACRHRGSIRPLSEFFRDVLGRSRSG
jgi:hypothetical protein